MIQARLPRSRSTTEKRVIFIANGVVVALILVTFLKGAILLDQGYSRYLIYFEDYINKGTADAPRSSGELWQFWIAEWLLPISILFAVTLVPIVAINLLIFLGRWTDDLKILFIAECLVVLALFSFAMTLPNV